MLWVWCKWAKYIGREGLALLIWCFGFSEVVRCNGLGWAQGVTSWTGIPVVNGVAWRVATVCVQGGMEYGQRDSSGVLVGL